MFKTIVREVRETAARPTRVGSLLRSANRSYALFRLRHGEAPMVDGTRQYRSYEHYVTHQRSKLALLDLSDYDRRFRTELAGRLATLDVEWQGKAVLCLAARLGTEVRAFTDLGALAIGIDLNPGPDNQYVLQGDFHHLQFADACFDATYTNSLDHALLLEQFVAEVKRVLRPGGIAIVEAMLGTEEGTGEFGRWEARSWTHVEELTGPFEAAGFELRSSDDFEAPWHGRRFVFALPQP